MSIESRFMIVGSDFLEKVGINAKPKKGWFFKPKKIEKAEGVMAIGDIKEPYYKPEVSCDLFEGDVAMEGKLASKYIRRMKKGDSGGISVYYIDDSAMKNFIRAANQEKDSRTLTAPKLTVHDGESAMMSVTTEEDYISGSKEVVDDKGKTFEPIIETLNTGLDLELKPLVLKDEKAVDLEIDFRMSDMLRFQKRKHKSGQSYKVPQWQQTLLKTRLPIPEGKTLIITGIKVAKGSWRKNNPRNAGAVKYGDMIVLLIKAAVIEGVEATEEAIEAYLD